MRVNTTIATFIAITLATALPGPQEPSAWLLAEETCDWAACAADSARFGFDCVFAAANRKSKFALVQCALSSGIVVFQISGCKGCWPTGIFKGAESDDLEGVDEEDVEEDNQGNDEDIVGEDAQGNDEDNVEEDVEEDVEEGVEEDAEEDTVEQDADEEIIRDGPPIIPVCELVDDDACPEAGGTFFDCPSLNCPRQLPGGVLERCKAHCVDRCKCPNELRDGLSAIF